MTVSQTLRVTSIRSQNPLGFGGCIFSAKPIDDQGRVQEATGYFVVKASNSVLGGALVEPGQWWSVAGTSTRRALVVNGYRIAETQIDATEAALLRPSGESIIAFMAESSAFEGIGRVKARRLWDAFGERLYEHLDAGNTTELAAVLTPDSATQVAAAWARHVDCRTLQWLQVHGFNLELSRKILQFFGSATYQRLEEDPYRLLSLSGAWRQTDALARKEFCIAEDDPRRLHGAIEEACYRAFTAGDTTLPTSKLADILRNVLGTQTKSFRWHRLVTTAQAQRASNGSYVFDSHGVQSIGALVMERQIARAVADRIRSTAPVLLPTQDVDEVLLAYEKAENIELNSPQRMAIQLAAAVPIVLITGGAGVGKTTVLKALGRVYDRTGITVTQLALAGRAAKRMQETTGRSASTIASFLCSSQIGNFDQRTVVVIDEASMVDVITMSRLCELLGPAPRLVLVGDPAQLMPVGPGLVLHALTRVPQMPIAQLTEVKRYGGTIAKAADSIRRGYWPPLPTSTEAEIGFISSCSKPSAATTASIAKTVLHLYKQDPTNTQVLCARRNGADGTKEINAMCQSALTADAEAVQVWDDQHDAYARVGLHLGDPVLCTRNLWNHGLQNGSLGVVVRVDEEQGRLSKEGRKPDLPLAWVDWDDGVRRPIVEEMLADLELGYAITVHKAQGSQWPRVIVPVTGHRLLDRTLIYTAVTRAQKQVLLVGDEEAARRAVEALPRARQRLIALNQHIADLMS